MTPWSHFLKQAATSTVKGSAVTLGSTVFACVLACYIEVGAHRLVYLCFPHKYANVEYANGLTQEQLDAVKPHNLKTYTPINEDAGILQVYRSSNMQESKPDDTLLTEFTTRFTTEFSSSSQRDNKKAPNNSSRTVIRPEQIIPGEELLSCSMTG